jgi:hypothetical protein
MTKKTVDVVNGQMTGIKKRGRKSKKELEQGEKQTNQNEITQNNTNNSIVEAKLPLVEAKLPLVEVKLPSVESQKHFLNENSNNITVTVEENNSLNDDNIIIDEIIKSDDDDDSKNNLLSQTEKQIGKKRGRKPKGGKIIQQITPLNNIKELKPNVILHLKCSLKDLTSNNLFGSSLEGFSFSNNNQSNLTYDSLNNENINFNEIVEQSSKLIDYEIELDTDFDQESSKKDNDIRDIWKKLKILEHYMHINNISNRKSACFWDTCEFDNPPIYIPKYFMNNSYHVYGCFCSPECAVAHLMNEPIDSSTKFERYYLLNSIYGKIYDYNKNIKPAPNPYYMLEKYYGNLSIQEYRALLRNERLFLVVDKPLTRIMPELHEDNDDFIINNKIIPSNKYQIKKRMQKKQTKNNILNERFGLTH